MVSKIESSNRMLQLTENELDKKRPLEGLKNSEEYTGLKNQIEEQINDFLNFRKDFKVNLKNILYFLIIL